MQTPLEENRIAKLGVIGRHSQSAGDFDADRDGRLDVGTW